MNDIRDNDSLISIDDLDFQPTVEECPMCGAPTSEWTETQDLLNWHCPHCGNDFPIDEDYNKTSSIESYDSAYGLDMTDDDWDALEDEDLDMLEEAIGLNSSSSKMRSRQVHTYRNSSHRTLGLGANGFSRTRIKESFFDKRITALSGAKDHDDQEELLYSSESEDKYKDGCTFPVHESIDDNKEILSIISEYEKYSDEIREIFDYCVRLFDALKFSGVEDISSGDLDGMICDGLSGAIEDDYDDTLTTDRESIVFIFDKLEERLGEDEAQELIERIEDAACSAERSESFTEDTVKVKGGYQNIGKKGKHSKKPMSKKAADAQRRAMFANGYRESVGMSTSRVNDSIATLIDVFMPDAAKDIKARIASGDTDALHTALRQIDRNLGKDIAKKIPESVIRTYKSFRESGMSDVDPEYWEAEKDEKEWDDPAIDERFICFDCGAEGSADELDSVDSRPACPICGSVNVDTYHEEDFDDEW